MKKLITLFIGCADLEQNNEELDTSFVFATHDEKIMGYLKRIIRLEDGNIVKDEKMKKEDA